MQANTTVVATPVSTTVEDVQADDTITTGGTRARVIGTALFDDEVYVTVSIPAGARLSVLRA